MRPGTPFAGGDYETMAFPVDSFLCIWLLITLFPDTMLTLYAHWSVLMKMASAKNQSEIGSQVVMFRQIIVQNSMGALLYFVIGFLLQAPIAMVFAGAFYSFIAFLAPVTIGRAFEISDWILISMELVTLLLAASISSSLATEIYNVDPEVRDLIAFWEKSWKTLFLKQEKNYQIELEEWRRTIVFLIGFVFCYCFL